MSAQLPKNCCIATGKFYCEETRDEPSSPWLLYPTSSPLSSNLNRSFKDELLFLKQLTIFGLFLTYTSWILLLSEGHVYWQLYDWGGGHIYWAYGPRLCSVFFGISFLKKLSIFLKKNSTVFHKTYLESCETLGKNNATCPQFK